VLGVLGYVAKKAVEQWLAQRLQQHKADLVDASQRALEKVRYDFRIAEAQQSRLLAKQAVILAGMFARLDRLHQALVSLAAPIQHEAAGAEPLRVAAIESLNDFTKYYYPRAIWLNFQTCTQVNDLLTLLRKLLMDMNYNLQRNGQIADRRLWLETYQRLQAEVPLARQALDRQFRALLGVEAGGLPEPTGPNDPGAT
jgi:hypothetical protein